LTWYTGRPPKAHVVIQNQVLKKKKKKPFQELLYYLHPSLTEKDIPHHTKIQKEILKCAATAEDWVHDWLAVIPSKISFTFDSWTSGAGNPYLSVTGHYIFAPADRPQE
jgi:hypothetical protein